MFVCFIYVWYDVICLSSCALIIYQCCVFVVLVSFCFPTANTHTSCSFHCRCVHCVMCLCVLCLHMIYFTLVVLLVFYCDTRLCDALGIYILCMLCIQSHFQHSSPIFTLWHNQVYVLYYNGFPYFIVWIILYMYLLILSWENNNVLVCSVPNFLFCCWNDTGTGVFSLPCILNLCIDEIVCCDISNCALYSVGFCVVCS
jgi:hypothetical protein